ncbi:MAG: hypothetical protein KDE62_00760 [Calditrichaeota bacterium]|nr:hypothetical protein [Calditrichota bacterium]
MSNTIDYSVSGRNGLLPGLIRDCQRAWGGISNFALYTIILSPVLIMLGGVVTALMGKAAYKFYTGEDQFAETLQILFFSSALILSVIIVKQSKRYYFVVSEFNEVLELCLAVGMFCLMLYQWKRLREGRV